MTISPWFHIVLQYAREVPLVWFSIIICCGEPSGVWGWGKSCGCLSFLVSSKRVL